MNKYLLTLSVLISLSVFAKTGKELIAENGFKPSVAPMLETHWSQDGGENSMLPLDNNGVRVKTGCGATAMAQILRYWKFPEHGFGSNFYYWQEIPGKEQVLYADFEKTYYEWDNMIPLYKNNASATQKQIDAVSTLMLHIGIALEMKYSKDGDNKTPTNIEYIHTVLKKYFGYNPNSQLIRYINGAYTMDEWLTMIYKELSEGRPVLMGGTYGNYNHIFVADGYDEDGNVHLNLGHAKDNEDKYYDLTRTDQTYTNNMRMIIGIYPAELEETVKIVNVITPGTLVDELGGKMESRKICRLKVLGTLNNTDISWLKELSSVTKGQLSYIDLSDCKIQGNSLQESAFDGCYTLQEIILPNSLTSIGTKAFRECLGLMQIQLPQSLNSIDNYAFSNCRYFSDVHLPSSLRSIGRNPFRYDKFDTFGIDSNNENYKMVNHALLNKDGTILKAMQYKCIGGYQVPNGVEVIAEQAFFKTCMISSFTLPSTLKQILSNAFYQCYSLKDVYCLATSAPTINGDSFDSSLSSCVLHVPSGCIEEYRQKGWTMFAQIIDDAVHTNVLKGDVNSDGTVDVADIATIIAVMAAGGGQTQMAVPTGLADVNGDGIVDVADIASVISIMAASTRLQNDGETVE